MMSTHNIYVIELSQEVLKNRKFKEANPDYISGKPLAYVGMTSRTPRSDLSSIKRAIKVHDWLENLEFGLSLGSTLH